MTSKNFKSSRRLHRSRCRGFNSTQAERRILLVRRIHGEHLEITIFSFHDNNVNSVIFFQAPGRYGQRSKISHCFHASWSTTKQLNQLLQYYTPPKCIVLAYRKGRTLYGSYTICRSRASISYLALQQSTLLYSWTLSTRSLEVGFCFHGFYLRHFAVFMWHPSRIQRVRLPLCLICSSITFNIAHFRVVPILVSKNKMALYLHAITE